MLEFLSGAKVWLANNWAEALFMTLFVMMVQGTITYLLGWKERTRQRMRDRQMNRMEGLIRDLQEALRVRAETDRSSDEAIFERLPGEGATGARLILKASSSDDAERILDQFEAAPNKTKIAYPYVALASRLIAENRSMEATNVLLQMPEAVPEHERVSAENYVWSLQDELLRSDAHPPV